MLPLFVICNEIIKKANMDNIMDLTPMKLQKLLYFIYGAYYAKYGEKLFAENFEAWQRGPVISSVYHEFKIYGANPIVNYSSDAEGNVYFLNQDNEEVKKFFSVFTAVWEQYKNIGAIELSDMTHKEGTPWSETFCNGIIDDTKILKYFKEQYNFI